MTGRLDGVHALITGAGGGIGAATARRLVSDGAQVLLADVNPDAVKPVAEQLDQSWVQVDVTSSGDIQRMVDTAYQRWGRLDVLFNNAGVAWARPMLEITEDDWDRLMSVNLRAVLQACARRMRTQPPISGSELRGKLINTASIAAFRGGQNYLAHYNASKSGVVSLTRTAANVLAVDRVTSNCICPGVVDTPMWARIDADFAEIEGLQTGEAWRRRTSLIPLGRPEKPEDIAGVIAFLASRDSDYMTGQAIIVDGGLVVG